jgi:serine/threonine protein phosphatase 1
LTEIITYAIGDIHGMAILLRRLLKEIEVDASAKGASPRLIFLGDLVDHGSSSDYVFELVAEAMQRWEGSKLLVGNHDQFFQEAAEGRMTKSRWDNWMDQGGDVTMCSISVVATIFDQVSLREYFTDIEPGYLALIRSALPNYVQGDHCFVHAGLRPGIPIADQTLRDMTWIRQEFLSHRESFEKIVIHGHSITSTLLPQVYPNRIAIDTGAYLPGGRLTALEIRDGIAASFISATRTTIERRSIDECRLYYDDLAQQVG